MPANDAIAAKDPAGFAVVVVAHGSRAPEANDAHRRLTAAVGARLGCRAFAAFLEIGEPDVPTAIDEAAATASELVVLPFFLLPGTHSRVDLPRHVEDARGRHPAADVTLLPHIGAADELVDLMARMITTR